MEIEYYAGLKTAGNKISEYTGLNIIKYFNSLELDCMHINIISLYL